MVLTGLTGSGKSTVLKTFEDLGFYCVDNLPVELIPVFANCTPPAKAHFRARRCWSTRARASNWRNCRRLLKHLRKDHPITLVFIEASDDALLRRFSETRRPHPLGKDNSVRESLRHERALMAPIRKLADVVIDTTQFNVHELRQFVTRAIQESGQAAADGFGGEFRIPLRNSDGCRSGF